MAVVYLQLLGGLSLHDGRLAEMATGWFLDFFKLGYILFYFILLILWYFL